MNTDSHPEDASVDPARRLAAHRGVTQLALPAGQSLVYREHVAPGLFVLLKGALELGEGRLGTGRRLEARKGRPIAWPSAGALAEAFEETLRTAEPSELLFLPRTLVQGDTEVRRLVEEIQRR